ncbi:MAG: YceI family protein [Candidatus Caenarcaniphilales bacterium]|nr:YceI family protein [Candidatus Caenarcaniphilales bacterium]
MNRRQIIKIALGLVLANSTLPSFAISTLNVLESQSQITWSGSKGIKALGTHTGTVAVKDGKVVINDAGEITKAEIEIDMSQIDNHDLSGEWKDKLLTHLKSPDFFDTAKHASAEFKSKKVMKLANNKYKLIGDMTIKGIKREAAIIGEYSADKDHNFKGTMSFDRTDFNIKFGSGQFFTNLGDKMIHDEVKLAFDIKAQ